MSNPVKMTLVFIFLFTWTGQSVFAQANELIVNVRNIDESKGIVYVALYDSKENYLKRDTFSQKTNAVKGNVQLVFSGLPFGEYAISAIHDANENKELDKNFLGIPSEGFGFCDGKMGTFGPPSFDKVKIIWNGGIKTIVVPLKYF
ncbi:MAG: DUF2141 domain-containing protein [Cyclobacteriaceae bacterium]|nr:DUF2141 domain-containing protein [Cyclobacteriaceae bacterium]